MLLLAFAGCAGGAASLPRGGVLASGDRQPADTASGLPGDTATGLPGDTATGLPGAQFACNPLAQPGQASCTLAVNLNVAPIRDPNTPSSLVPGLHPSDLQSAYALGSGSGSVSGTVAIVDAYDDPSAESDLAVYRATFGLPPCRTTNGCFRKVDQRGGTAYPAANAGWSQEIALDLDVVSAICPNCTILLVEASSASLDDLGAAVDTAVSLGARAVSNSYYAAEWQAETGEDGHYAHPGVAIVVSAGDRPQPSYPATSPGVLAVGGTTMTNAGGVWSESAWGYGGRGCSAYEPKPRWQQSSSCPTRAAVDVSAVADPQTGVASFASFAGGWRVVGGTSVGAPLVAAASVLAGGTFPGAWWPYAHPTAFHDIPPAGDDPVTGLGSPRGVAGL